jgi:hypothetical protein
MGSTATKAGAFAGWFKNQYSDVAGSVFSKNRILADLFPFDKKSKTGENYVQAVRLTRAGGLTYTTANATTYTSLNTPISASVGEAKLQGSELIGRQWLTFKAAANAMNNKDSFGSVVDLAVEALMDEMEMKREIAMIDGQAGLATTTTGTADDSDQETVTISAKSWSTARWFGKENEQYNFYNGTNLISTGANSVFTLISVDPDTRKLTFTGTSTGCTALHSAVAASGAALTIYINGSYGKEMVGLNKIATNTGSLYGIDASTYGVWKGQSLTLTAASIDKADLFMALAKARNRGARGEMCALMPTIGMAHLLDQMSDQQRWNDQSGKKGMDIGAEALRIWTPSGWCKLIPDELCRDGEGYVFPEPKTVGAKRVGSTEFTWGAPAMEDDAMVDVVQGTDCLEIRAYADEAMFLPAPAQVVKIIAQNASSTL